MAKLPTIRRFSLEDFKDQRDWISRLLDPLNSFIASVAQAFDGGLTQSENMVAQTPVVRVRTNKALTAGSSFATDYAKTFVDADVNAGTEVVTIVAHGFNTGDRVQLTTSGVLPAGLALLTDYWVTRTGADTFTLAATFAAAFAGTAVNITAAAGGGTHTISKWAELPAYAGIFEKPKFSVTMKNKPIGVVPMNCVEVAASQPLMPYPVGIQWSYKDGVVTLDQVSGLEPNRQYDLTLWACGG